MMLHVFDIPETRDERVTWLERHVTGLHLAELVAELRAVHRPAEEVSLEQLVGPQLPGVLKSGLSGLENRQLQSLLRNPGSLFELQEQVLLSGSEYWSQFSQKHAEGLKMSFDASKLMPDQPAVPLVKATLPAPRQHRSWYSHPLFVSLMTAAAVLFATNLKNQNDTGERDPSTVASSAWGWDRPGAQKTDVIPVAYLNHLADSAEEWFRKRPDNAHDVAVRIAQFRQGCSTLILADHTPLSKTDRTWLVDKCRAWAGKLDSHLAAVEARESPSDVLAATDETIRKLVIAIRGRAKELSA